MLSVLSIFLCLAHSYFKKNVLPRRTFVFLPFFFYSQKVWLFNQFSAISESRALFTNPQISLFSNFFIKNRSHGIIHTFKNYFSTVFLVKYAISKRTLSICLDTDENFHVQRFSIFYFFILGRSVFLWLYVTPMGLVYYL